LDYLTELFESGRWRRFFGETAFLENIKEAKTAVETWRSLLYREATRDNRPIDLSWLGHNQQLAPRHAFEFGGEPIPPRRPELPPTIVREPEPEIAAETSPRLKIVAETAPPVNVPDEVPAWQHALDPVFLRERYPLLRQVG
jgi:uncharacterized repeat protein (TIGR03809 family)